MSDHTQLRAEVLSAPPYRLFAALWGGLALVDVGRALEAPAAAQVALLALLVAGCCVGQGRGTAFAVAAIAWLVVTGFVTNTGGELRVSGLADAVRLALLVVVALAATEVRR